MLISDTGQFVLLMNPKTGTTALSRALRGSAAVWVSDPPADKHMDYAQFQARLAAGDWGLQMATRVAQYPVYAVVRDPLQTLFSWFRYRRRPALQRPDHPRHHRSTAHMTFPQFLTEWSRRTPPDRANVTSGESFVFADSGRQYPMQVYRYADLDALTQHLSSRLGGHVPLQRLNTSPGNATMCQQAAAGFTSARLEAAVNRYRTIGFVQQPLRHSSGTA